MMTLLEALRDDLATIPGVKTCQIGIEANVSPVDYPLIRIVPSKIFDSAVIQRRRVDCWIYFGTNVSEAEGGLEAVYSALFDLEDQIRTRVAQFGGFSRETLLDEDRLQPYKMMAVRAEVEG